MDAGLGRQEKLVLYSEGGIHSAQAWMLLKAQGYQAVYMLTGGLEEWKDQVLFPVLADNPTPDQRAGDETQDHAERLLRRSAAQRLGAGRGRLLCRAALRPACPRSPKWCLRRRLPARAKAPAKKKKEGC